MKAFADDDVSPHRVYDMAGNASEVCASDATRRKARTIRGGSWARREDQARVASRQIQDPGTPYKSLGFRLARDVPVL